MNTRSIAPILGLAMAAGVLLAPAPALAQMDFGVRGGLYMDAEEPFLGADLLTRIGGPNSRWFFNPNVEVVFVDDSLITLNLDAHYDLPIDGPTYLWVGGGPAVIFDDPPGRRRDSETDFGFNALAGIGWRVGSLVPYLQAKLVLSDDTEGVLAAGLRF